MLPSTPLIQPDLPAQSVHIMCAALERLGEPAAPLLIDAGIDPDTLNAPGARISAAREFAFQRAFMQATRHCPGAWLDTGCQYRLVSFGEFGLAMLAAVTMREAVQFAIEHATLAFTQCRFAWVHDAGATQSGLAIITDEVDEDMAAFSLERDLGAIRTMVDDMWQGRFPLAGIELALPDRGQRPYFEAILQTPVSFPGRRNAVYFSDQLLDQRLPLGDAILGSTYAQRCDRRLRRSDSKAADTVHAVLTLLYDAGGAGGAGGAWPDIVTVAHRLKLSERGLRRHLHAAGTSFRQLAQRVREQRARDMLQTSDLAVERIAEELGYAEAASFSHAFRRWTGQSPRTFRRVQQRSISPD